MKNTRTWLVGLLDQFKVVSNRPFIRNFRCPYCGDSQKKKNKKRAYLFEKTDSLFFHCHNCGSSRNFSNFLQERSQGLYQQFKLELLKSKSIKPKVFNDDKLKTITKFEKPKLYLGTTLSKCSESDPVLLYAKKRKIPEEFFPYLFSCEDITNITLQIERYSKLEFDDQPVLVIPFYDKEMNYSHISCRSINKEASFRFYVFEIDEALPKIWGLQKVNWDDPVYVFEGPIDAMCVPNSLALGGSMGTQAISLIKNHINNDITFVYDNEIFSNKQILKQVKNRIDENFGVVIYDKNFKAKDINEAIEYGGMSQKSILDYLKKRTFKGLAAKLELSKINKPKNR